MSMTYVPSWERKYNSWDLEPEVWDKLEDEESESNSPEISLEEISEEDLLVELDENFDE